MMKRIVFMVTLALVMTAMMALAGGPAFATIHPLANSECSSENASAVAQGQNPPGLSGQSQGTPPNNPTGGNIAQPVFAASGGNPFSEERPSPAFKTFGTTLEDLDAEYCPASK